LFRLNQVDENELIAKADSLSLARKGGTAAKVLGGSKDLAEPFGLDMARTGQQQRLVR
jgi:hypothetical protein